MTSQNSNNDILIKYKYLTWATTEYTPDNGWRILEVKNYQDTYDYSKEVLGESEVRKGIRLIKVKPLSEEPEGECRENYKYLLCNYNDEDLENGNLNKSELQAGVRYLKVWVPYYFVNRGWLSMNELNSGWDVCKPHCVVGKKRRNRNRMTRKLVFKYVKVREDKD